MQVMYTIECTVQIGDDQPFLRREPVLEEDTDRGLRQALARSLWHTLRILATPNGVRLDNLKLSQAVIGIEPYTGRGSYDWTLTEVEEKEREEDRDQPT